MLANTQVWSLKAFLKNGNPHSDFPSSLSRHDISDIKLTEYQLLHDKPRHYTITDDYIQQTQDYIEEGILRMNAAGCFSPYKELDIENFETADKCTTCQFKKICWEN